MPNWNFDIFQSEIFLIWYEINIKDKSSLYVVETLFSLNQWNYYVRRVLSFFIHFADVSTKTKIDVKIWKIETIRYLRQNCWSYGVRTTNVTKMGKKWHQEMPRSKCEIRHRLCLCRAQNFVKNCPILIVYPSNETLTLNFLQIMKNWANIDILIYGAPNLTGGNLTGAQMTSRSVIWRHHVRFGSKFQNVFLSSISGCYEVLQSIALSKVKIWLILFL